ncbi:MAG: lipopolysaccharide biosynthesis protein, partial [Gemmatimonadales bacterium]
MSRDPSIGKRTLVFTAARVAGSGSILVLFVLLSYLLSAPEYGTFRQVWLVNKGLLDILALGVPLSVYYFIPRLAEEHKRHFVAQSFLVLAGLGLTLAVGVFLSAGVIARVFDNPQIEPLLRLFALYPLFVMPVTGLESVLLSLGRSGQYSGFLILDRLGLVATAAVAVLVGRSLNALFLALVAFGAVELVAGGWLAWYSVGHLPRGPGGWRIGEQLRFALPSGLANLVDVINVEVDKLMAAAFFTVAQFASFANGAFEVPFLSVIVGSVGAMLLPEFSREHARGDRGTILRLWHGAITRVAKLLAPATVFLFVMAGDVVQLLFSSKYADSVPIFRIYLLILLPKLAWFGPTLVALGRNRAPFYGSLIAVGSNVVLGYLLIHWIGLPGPAVATVVTAHLLMLYYLVLLQRTLRITWGETFPLRPVLLALVVAAIPGVLILPVAQADGLGRLG